jgi:SAM-dependent methyltransferase
VLDWDHNAYYHRLLLRQMPQPCRRVLDVGCGAGAFAARLARRSEQVDALDRSAKMIEEAERRTPGNVNCVLADVLSDPLPGKDYDAVFSISALHHMPLQDVLPVLAAALRPGGVLAAVALPRLDLRREWPVEIAAAAGHRLLGAMFLTTRLLGGGNGFAKDSAHATMPVVMDPPLTTREAARQAATVLPGVRVRRLLFWRYLLVWQKPISRAAGKRDSGPREGRSASCDGQELRKTRPAAGIRQSRQPQDHSPAKRNRAAISTQPAPA